MTAQYRISIDLCINRAFPVVIDLAFRTQQARDLVRDLSTGGVPRLRREVGDIADTNKREVTEHVSIA